MNNANHISICIPYTDVYDIHVARIFHANDGPFCSCQRDSYLIQLCSGQTLITRGPGHNMKRKKLILEDKNKLYTMPWYWCNYRDVHHGTVNRSLFKLGKSHLLFYPRNHQVFQAVTEQKIPAIGSPGKRICCTCTFRFQSNF